MSLCPIQQSQLKLRHTGQQFRILITALTQLSSHICTNLGNTRVILMLFIGNQQIQLRVFLNFNAQLIQALDRCIAGEEVLRPRAESDHFQCLYTNNSAGNGQEVVDHISTLGCCAHRVFRNVSLQMTHAQIIRAVQHTTERIATTVDQITVAFSCSNIHGRTIKLLADQSLRSLRTKVT